MKRGSQILIVLVLIIVVLVVAAFFVFNRSAGTTANVTPTPPLVGIVVAKQPINRDEQIKAEALDIMEYPQNRITEKMVTLPTQIVGQYAAYPLYQGMYITTDMVSERPGANRTGSQSARFILPGQVAVTLPLNWQSGVAFALRDGDHVNVIVTTLFVDVDSGFQSILPNNFGQVVNTGLQPENSTLVTLGMNNGGGLRTVGRAELDPVLNQAIYYIPSEAQRPRLVSQMILQNVAVLHVGEFPLQDAATTGTTTAPAAAPADQQAAAGQPTPVPASVKTPDIITLVVSPQDAVALTYLLYGGAKFTFTLRAPDDESQVETDAATLQFILSQYAIPVPAKLPYAIEPRIDQLSDPVTVAATPTPAAR